MVGPATRQLIQGYGGGRFRISGQAYEGSVLVFAQHTLAWPVENPVMLTLDSLGPVVAAGAAVDILLLGCGTSAAPIDNEVRAGLRGTGIAIEVMDTGAACRTFNLLLAEDRLVAAALIAVP